MYSMKQQLYRDLSNTSNKATYSLLLHWITHVIHLENSDTQSAAENRAECFASKNSSDVDIRIWRKSVDQFSAAARWSPTEFILY